MERLQSEERIERRIKAAAESRTRSEKQRK